MLQCHNHNYYHHYLQCDLFRTLSEFGKRLRNVFGSCRHLPHAMFHKYSKAHNRGISVGFIKLPECRLAGEHIALCRILQLQVHPTQLLTWWARGALAVLPQPQLQGASGTVIAARFDGLVAGCLT
jgi:hypothetical protein